MNSDSQNPSVTKILSIDGQDLHGLIEASILWIKANQQVINSLNVFPVPDGDTGTNMLLTMQAAFSEINGTNEKNIGKFIHSLAQGALMGARGNSGVILSQLWRGFSRALDNLETMDAPTMIRALIEARNTAYKGVVRPVEGTILTVAKDITSAAELALTQTDDLVEILEKIVIAGIESVNNTPELLPILKQAGVVDAGGKGLLTIFEGILRKIKGLPLETSLQAVQPLAAMNLENAEQSIEPGQDFEIVVDFQPSKPIVMETIFEDLSRIGTSIQVGEGDGLYRIHIHVPTENFHMPVEYIMKLGTVTKVNIENLLAQMEANKQKNTFTLALVEPDQIAVVAVSPGMGISRIFTSLGVAGIVEGGQSMNPSTEEILKAFEDLPTDKIIILPNNKNIILAAQSAASVSVKNVLVIPSKSVPQGLSAMLRYNPDSDFDEIAEEMTRALADVETGEITIATRSVQINGVNVHEGEVITLYNGELINSANSLDDACLGLLEKANTNERERITLFYGNSISLAEVNRIVDLIRGHYPSHEIELHEGGQPFYQFIISIE